MGKVADEARKAKAELTEQDVAQVPEPKTANELEAFVVAFERILMEKHAAGVGQVEANAWLKVISESVTEARKIAGV